jgi:hypothetical protein
MDKRPGRLLQNSDFTIAGNIPFSGDWMHFGGNEK